MISFHQINTFCVFKIFCIFYTCTRLVLFLCCPRKTKIQNETSYSISKERFRSFTVATSLSASRWLKCCNGMQLASTENLALKNSLHLHIGALVKKAAVSQKPRPQLHAHNSKYKENKETKQQDVSQHGQSIQQQGHQNTHTYKTQIYKNVTHVCSMMHPGVAKTLMEKTSYC